VHGRRFGATGCTSDASRLRSTRSTFLQLSRVCCLVLRGRAKRLGSLKETELESTGPIAQLARARA
jgi:hypothetical protein